MKTQTWGKVLADAMDYTQKDARIAIVSRVLEMLDKECVGIGTTFSLPSPNPLSIGSKRNDRPKLTIKLEVE